MSTTHAAVAVALVSLTTLGIGAFGLRVSRTTSDFYVASRSVSPSLNSSAIGGEYLSAASFLGVAGLVLTSGPDVLWYPIGWTTGYLLLLVLVAAPLRRSGAYTIPDFAQVRLQSVAVRRAATLLVVGVGWLYLMPQFQGAGLTLRSVSGSPDWVGMVLVAGIVVVNVVAGGMRSITFVQAFQYWLKLTALLVPAVFLLRAWALDGTPSPVAPDAWFAPWSTTDAQGLYTTYSVLVATFLGTMGLPHVVVRFYTNPDGHAARRTTLIVLGLIGGFYLLPTVYGVLGRVYASDLVAAGRGAGRRALRPGHRRRVRGLPVDVVGPHHGDRGRRRPEPLGRSPRGTPLPHLLAAARGSRLRPRPAGPGARRRADPRRELRDLRVRARGVDVLPVAGAGHLVARPHRTRSPGGHGRRRARRAARHGGRHLSACTPPSASTSAADG